MSANWMAHKHRLVSATLIEKIQSRFSKEFLIYAVDTGFPQDDMGHFL
jgi:hypothetical protein